MNINNKYCLEIWIGLAKVQTEKKQIEFKNAKNAYVNVLGLAKNKIDFKKRIKKELSILDFKLIRLEEPEIFSNRIVHHKIDKSLYRLAKELIDGDSKIRFSIFHTYD